MHRFKHLITVLKHKHYVFKYARKLHIPWLGFKHDLSKFSYTEFHLSAKYYAGDKSPTIIERQYNDGVSKITYGTGKKFHIVGIKRRSKRYF